MRSLILYLSLCSLILIPVHGRADDPAGSSPDVRAVLFYDPGTSRGKELFAFYLPGLYERYGTRLEVSGVDLSQAVGKRAYRSVAPMLGLSSDPGEEPIVIVAGRAVVGLVGIAATLGDDFEELAREPSSKRWPTIPALQPLLPRGIENVKTRMAAEGALSEAEDRAQLSTEKSSRQDQVAKGLAVLVLLGMVVTLIHSLVRLRQRNRATGPPTSWALLLALVMGLGIAGYTAYTALADVVPMCGPIAGCAEVQGSEYSKLFGVPLGVIGLVGYSLVLVGWLTARYLSPQGGGWHWLPWSVALFGVLFSLRLTALEAFVIGATCLWCLGSAVSITVALWLLSGYVGKGRGQSRGTGSGYSRAQIVETRGDRAAVSGDVVSVSEPAETSG
jgi:uncharacterized membrane protein